MSDLRLAFVRTGEIRPISKSASQIEGRKRKVESREWGFDVSTLRVLPATFSITDLLGRLSDVWSLASEFCSLGAGRGLFRRGFLLSNGFSLFEFKHIWFGIFENLTLVVSQHDLPLAP